METNKRDLCLGVDILKTEEENWKKLLWLQNIKINFMSPFILKQSKQEFWFKFIDPSDAETQVCL